MTKDKGDLDEEIKKLEQELAVIKADEADDTWTEKVNPFTHFNLTHSFVQLGIVCDGLRIV
jgi:hypothetical protein